MLVVLINTPFIVLEGIVNDKLENIGNVFLGWCILAAGIVACLFLINGAEWMVINIYPLVGSFFRFVFGISIFLLLPLSIFWRTRIVASIGLFYASYIFGLTTWMWGLLVCNLVGGLVLVVVGLVFAGVGVVPLAMLGCVVVGAWGPLGNLVTLLSITYGSRLLGLFLLSKCEQRTEQKDVGLEISTADRHKVTNPVVKANAEPNAARLGKALFRQLKEDYLGGFPKEHWLPVGSSLLGAQAVIDEMLYLEAFTVYESFRSELDKLACALMSENENGAKAMQVRDCVDLAGSSYMLSFCKWLGQLKTDSRPSMNETFDARLKRYSHTRLGHSHIDADFVAHEFTAVCAVSGSEQERVFQEARRFVENRIRELLQLVKELENPYSVQQEHSMAG